MYHLLRGGDRLEFVGAGPSYLRTKGLPRPRPIMSFHKLDRALETPRRADKSAPTEVWCSLTVSWFFRSSSLSGRTDADWSGPHAPINRRWADKSRPPFGGPR